MVRPFGREHLGHHSYPGDIFWLIGQPRLSVRNRSRREGSGPGAATGDEYRRRVKALDMYVIDQHTYLWGPRVATFNVAQEWIAGYDGEMGLGTCQWTQIYPRIWVDSQLKAELN